MPLADFSVDRVLLVHGIEFSEQIRPMLKEAWRVLAGGGRLAGGAAQSPRHLGADRQHALRPGPPLHDGPALAALARGKLHARAQRRRALRAADALHKMLRSAVAWEGIGERWLDTFGGVVMVEAVKATAPERAGFTGDLSIGGSITTRTVTSTSLSSNGTFTEETSIELEPGFAPLGVSLGGYFTPRFALLGRLAGTSYFRGSHQYLQLFTGPVVEYWPHDRWFLAGGMGLGTFTPNPLTGSSVVRPGRGSPSTPARGPCWRAAPGTP